MAVPVVELWSLPKVFVTVNTRRGAEPMATTTGPQSNANRTGTKAKRLVKLCWGDVSRSARSTATKYPQANSVERYLSTSQPYRRCTSGRADRGQNASTRTMPFMREALGNSSVAHFVGN